MSNPQNNNGGKVNWAALKLGALWLKDNGNGRYSGTVTIDGVTRKIVGFPKRDDASPQSPDISLHFLPDDAANPTPTQQQTPPPAKAKQTTQTRTAAPTQNRTSSPAKDSQPLL